MQAEFNAHPTAVPIRILGVNAAGLEAGNAAICSGRSLPWLQDTTTQNVWGSWAVTWRDVIVLDRSSQRILVYNLTSHDLANPASYAELKNALIAAATAP